MYIIEFFRYTSAFFVYFIITYLHKIASYVILRIRYLKNFFALINSIFIDNLQYKWEKWADIRIHECANAEWIFAVYIYKCQWNRFGLMKRIFKMHKRFIGICHVFGISQTFARSNQTGFIDGKSFNYIIYNYKSKKFVRISSRHRW